MKRSLSLYLSVAQASPALQGQVAGALEILAELDPDFELVLVDRVGTEETTELTRSLAATYPQVRVAASELSLLGDSLPMRSRPRPEGQVVLVADASAELRASDLRWQYYSAQVSPKLPSGWTKRHRKKPAPAM